jgi:hypothetical protein
MKVPLSNLAINRILLPCRLYKFILKRVLKDIVEGEIDLDMIDISLVQSQVREVAGSYSSTRRGLPLSPFQILSSLLPRHHHPPSLTPFYSTPSPQTLLGFYRAEAHGS